MRGKGEGESSHLKSFATNLLYYQHHSIFANMKKSSKNQKKERKEFTVHICWNTSKFAPVRSSESDVNGKLVKSMEF